MICNYLIDIFIKKVNIILQAIILGNGKGSRKLEIKIDYVVNNVLLMVPTLSLSVDLKFGKIFIKTLKIKSNLI